MSSFQSRGCLAQEFRCIHRYSIMYFQNYSPTFSEGFCEHATLSNIILKLKAVIRCNLSTLFFKGTRRGSQWPGFPDTPDWGTCRAYTNNWTADSHLFMEFQSPFDRTFCPLCNLTQQQVEAHQICQLCVCVCYNTNHYLHGEESYIAHLRKLRHGFYISWF